MHPLAERLMQRAATAGLELPEPLGSRLLAYYDLLYRWNKTINLTALRTPDDAIDRLLLEPVAAARFLPQQQRFIDLGSGGGSPAIPLALTLNAPLVMVESKGRKAAFLREAARHVGLLAEVKNARFEEAASSSKYRSAFQTVTMRAVRMDADSLASAAAFLSSTGQLALFVSAGSQLSVPPGRAIISRHSLVSDAELLILR